MVWVFFALLTGAAVFAVLWPLSRAPLATDSRELDVAFYKAQTAEIERDAARGVIGPQEADIARNEAGRRLVAASQRDVRDVTRSSRFAAASVALGALIFVPGLALTLYLRVGAPNLPDDPLEARLNADPQTMDMATIVAKIEGAVAKNPNDGRGWSLLARIYSRLGRNEESAAAYRNEIRVLGPNEERLAGLGEAETAVNGGKITPEVKKEFEQAVSLNPKSPRARFYLGLASEQEGRKTEAVTIWKRLVADSPPNAPWVPTVESRIAAAGGEPVPLAGESDARGKMAATVAGMPKDQQQAMIHGMVDRLAERLKTNGGDLDGWLRLVRAYRVLEESDKAKTALTDARRNFASEPAATKRLDDLAHELGLES